MTALSALPALPIGGCPPAAGALGAAGLGPVCQAASGVSGLAGSAASQVAGAGVNGVLNGLGGWVAEGAAWLLNQIGAVIGATTTVDLGASWFTTHYRTMAALAAMVVVPLLLLGIMQAIYRQSLAMLLRSALVHVPLAILLTGVAVKLVQLGLALTDAMSAAVAQGAGLDGGHFMGSVIDALSGASAAGSPGAPAFVLFLGALVVVFGAVMVWIELLLRAAAVYVAVLFLPLALASLAWPAVAHWCRRLVDTLVALVLGKFVIVSVLSLAAGALAGGTGLTPAGAGSTGSSGGFSAVLGGAALLLLAAFSPWALFRLLPFIEAGAVGHLEGVGRRAHQVATVPVRSLAQVAMRSAAAGGLGAAGSALAASGVARGATAGRGGRPSVVAGVGRGGSPDPSATPDPGPSSAQTTGVGTLDPPGHSIPDWEPNARAGAAAGLFLDGVPWSEARSAELERLVEEAGGWLHPAVLAGATDGQSGGSRSAGGAGGSRETGGAGGAGRGDLVRLPLATAARAPAWLGRDELGPRLLANRPPELPPAEPDD